RTLARDEVERGRGEDEPGETVIVPLARVEHDLRPTQAVAEQDDALRAAGRGDVEPGCEVDLRVLDPLEPGAFEDPRAGARQEDGREAGAPIVAGEDREPAGGERATDPHVRRPKDAARGTVRVHDREVRRRRTVTHPVETQSVLGPGLDQLFHSGNATARHSAGATASSRIASL